MKKYKYLYAVCLTAVGLMTACSQEELTDGNALPEGRYPVEIASVSIGGEGSAQPWGADAPQTRAEDEEYNGEIRTLWQEGDIFYMKFKDGDGIGSYTVTGSGGKDRGKTLYWRSTTREETLVSWFTQPSLDADGGMLDISDQSERLAYVCRKEQPVKYGGGDITVVLEHQLAKVRVYVQGTGYEGNATGVSINGVPATCTVTDGVPTSAETGTITMHPTTLNNAACFEVNLLPGKVGGDDSFTVAFGSEDPITLDVEEFEVDGGNIYTVNLRLQKKDTEVVDLSGQASVYEINDNKMYFFYCSKASNKHGIRVTGGTPTIYLANVNLDVTDGNAINIEGGGTTAIIVQGNSTVTSSDGAGIYVASGSSVTIQGNSRSDMLTARGADAGSGIGGYMTDSKTFSNCGNISIKNVSLNAHGSKDNFGNYSAGIGGVPTANASYGTISIENALVHAYGATDGSETSGAPGIGTGIYYTAGGSEDVPTIRITDSYIYAHRGANADYIGLGGDSGNPRDGVRFGTDGYCKSSTIICCPIDSDDPEKIETYLYDGTKV